jgi:hypothetical protein
MYPLTWKTHLHALPNRSLKIAHKATHDNNARNTDTDSDNCASTLLQESRRKKHRNRRSPFALNCRSNGNP